MFTQKVKELYEELYWEYDCIGIRFEEKVREDEREFPEYGTAEYEVMDEMDGVSTWSLMSGDKFSERVNGWLWDNSNADVSVNYLASHAYIVVGDTTGWEQTNGLIDDGELLIQNGKVVAVLF